MNEEWKQCPSWPAYEASTLGNVRRKEPTFHSNRTKIGMLTQVWDSRKRYKRVCIRHNGKGTCKAVHQIVADAFLGPRCGDLQVNHIDGVKTNNCPSNLEYVTNSQNQIHALQLGLRLPKRGESHKNARLNSAQIEAIMRLEGLLPQHEIARMFGVCLSTINHIYRGRLWGHLTGRKVAT